MDNTGMISVIIPVYNVEEYLRKCLDSVLNQTYQRFEIILVDDGSTDDSARICEEYAREDSRISVINKQNAGASSARNIGMNQARGEYIYFLDSDDYLLETAFEKLIAIGQRDKADVVFFEGTTFAECEKKLIGNYGYNSFYDKGVGCAVLNQLVRNKEFHVSVPLLLIRNDYLHRARLSFVEGIMYEDMIFTFKLFYMAPLVSHCNQELYFRRYRNASVMTATVTSYNFISIQKVYWSLVNFANQINHTMEEAFTLHIIRIAMNCMNIFDCLSKEEKTLNRAEYYKIREDILNKKSFGSKALKARCYGKIPWSIVRVFEKAGI